MNNILERKNIYMLILALCLSFAAILIIFKYTGFQNIEYILKINLAYVLLILGIIFLSLLVDTLRIKELLNELGEDLSLRYLFKFNLSTFFIAYITPFGSGALPLTLYLMKKKHIPPNKSLMIITAKVLFSGLFFGTIPPLLLIFFRKQLELTHTLSIFAILISIFLLLLIVGVIYVILRPKFIIGIVNWIEGLPLFKRRNYKVYFNKAREEIYEYNKRFNELFMVSSGGKLFFSQLLYAIVFWLLFYSIAPIILMMMNIPFSIFAVMARQLIFYDILSYNFIPSGAGFVEVGFAGIFSNIVPHNLLGIFIAIWRFFTYYIYLILSGIGFFFTMKKQPKIK
ncbi:flippase-like domain-containing protein [Aceticella autotrophica]|uniref:Phosphatidylglycerol lysyltransferase n=1 Tax=Aceticella autotrophica TaxID=2755338 RepID=A0A975AUQ9_9THEO|nr:lysylphosphatidylglycerol synthase transmembrane domain-containing protein [Aceticella autotrophica]QSZ26804.1 flippase-like domain-containing protein [Aceticella autotrophica]